MCCAPPSLFADAVSRLQSGTLFKSITEGRKELLGIVKRTRYNEIGEAKLGRKKLRKSPLGMQFHIRDALGLGMLERFQLGSGAFFRIPHQSAVARR